jgi:hypothetical protein
MTYWERKRFLSVLIRLAVSQENWVVEKKKEKEGVLKYENGERKKSYLQGEERWNIYKMNKKWTRIFETKFWNNEARWI